MSDEKEIYTHSDTFGIVVDHYGDARGTKSQFQNSDPADINPLINENAAAFHFATDHLSPQLTSIRSALEACWTGSSANNALSILTQLSTNSKTIGTNTKACHDSFVHFQQSWTSCKSDAGSLYEGVGGSGANEDNDGAHRVYGQFNTAMQTSMRAMPAQLQYSEPLDSQHSNGPGPGPGGGPGGSGPGPGHYGPGPGHYGPGPVSLGPGPVSSGPGWQGHPVGPGNPGSPGGPGAAGPGGTYQGGNGGLGGTGGPGAGVDTGSQLSSYTGGGMGSPGPGFGGPGFGGPGPGGLVTGASGLSGSTAGLGTVGAGAGIGGVGAAESEAGAASERGLLGGRGAGGGGGSDEDERDRTTWLSEEEGIWDGETTAPPGTIA